MSDAGSPQLTQSETPHGIDRPPRDNSIDVLKGIGILVVAMGHIDYSGVGGAFISYLYTFNVALFFIVAGYMWREKPGVSVLAIIWLKFRQIYVPYVVLFAVSILYGNIVVRFIFHQYVIPFEWKATLEAFVFSSQWLNSVPTFNFALWFLPIFFVSSVVFQFLQKIRNLYMYCAVLLLIVIASIPVQQWIPGRPILTINVLPVALGFMGLGYLIRRWLPVEKLNLFVLIPIFGFTLWAAYKFPGNVSAIASYWYFPSALASFILYLRLAQQLRSSSFLGYIGRNSLIIFGIHTLVANTYPFSHLLRYFSPTWDGLMLYLINLAYVILGSVLIVRLYRWLRSVVMGWKSRSRFSSVARTGGVS